MSGIAPSEFLLICLIALLILGPERLPVVAKKVGGWIGRARQMTRSLQRQLEDEVSVEKNFGFDPKELDPTELMKPPNDNDTYSPIHDEEDRVDEPDVEQTVADEDVVDETDANGATAPDNTAGGDNQSVAAEDAAADSALDDSEKKDKAVS